MHRDRRRATHWALGLVAVLLAAGGIFAGISLTSHPAPTAASPGSAAHPGGQAGAGRTGGAATALPGGSDQGAMLNATLSSASAPGQLQVSASSAAAGPGAAASRAGACARVRHWARAARRAGFPGVARARRIAARRCHLARRLVFRFYLLHGVDGQFTIQTRDGMKTLAFERGVVQSVSAGGLVVKAANGTTWTWHFFSRTVVRDRGGKVARSAVSAGETVWAGGPVISGAKDARLIVVSPPGVGS